MSWHARLVDGKKYNKKYRFENGRKHRLNALSKIPYKLVIIGENVILDNSELVITLYTFSTVSTDKQMSSRKHSHSEGNDPSSEWSCVSSQEHFFTLQ